MVTGAVRTPLFLGLAIVSAGSETGACHLRFFADATYIDSLNCNGLNRSSCSMKEKGQGANKQSDVWYIWSSISNGPNQDTMHVPRRKIQPRVLIEIPKRPDRPDSRL